MNHDEDSKKRDPRICQPENEGAEIRRPVRPGSELKALNEEELKAALKSGWKKYERLATKEMGELLYWLRDKLRAQGGRNDMHDKDGGFGSWVEDNLRISHRTAGRWADEYGIIRRLVEEDRL